MGVLNDVKHQGTSLADTAVRQLTGKGLPGGRGFLDLLIGRRELAETLIGKAKDMMHMDGIFQKQIEDMLSCHTNYRSLVANDPTWIGGQSPANQNLLTLLEDILFRKSFDEHIKAAKLSHTIVGLFEKEPMASRMNDLDALVEKDTVMVGDDDEGGKTKFRDVL